MATLRVVFFGLISHVSKNRFDKKHAAIIDDYPTHKPEIYFGARGRVPIGRGRITFQDGSGKRIKGRAISTDNQFQRFVPHLLELTNGDIRSSVDRATNMDDIYAYFEYPGGKLAARSLYECQGQYTLPGKIVVQCVAKTVLLTATVEAEEIAIVYPDVDGVEQTTDVTDTCILVTNAERIPLAERRRLAAIEDCDDMMSTHEFGKHIDITDASIIASLRPSGKCTFPFVPPDDEGCSWIETTLGAFRDSFEVECGNSQYP